MTPDKAPRRWPMFELVATEYSEHEQFVLASDHDRMVAEMQKRIAKLEAALKFIANGCLVPPDGGQPCFDDAIQSAREALKEEGS